MDVKNLFSVLTKLITSHFLQISDATWKGVFIAYKKIRTKENKTQIRLCIYGVWSGLSLYTNL